MLSEIDPSHFYNYFVSRTLGLCQIKIFRTFLNSKRNVRYACFFFLINRNWVKTTVGAKTKLISCQSARVFIPVIFHIQFYAYEKTSVAINLQQRYTGHTNWMLVGSFFFLSKNIDPWYRNIAFAVKKVNKYFSHSSCDYLFSPFLSSLFQSVAA